MKSPTNCYTFTVEELKSSFGPNFPVLVIYKYDLILNFSFITTKCTPCEQDSINNDVN